jgi:tetratricopeptide (TPR) repeat protein
LIHEKAIIYYHLEKFPETISLCTKLTQNGEIASDVITMLGASNFMIKNYKSCIESFEMEENNKTANESAYYYMAMSYKALSNQENAIVYFKKAIEAAISSNVDSYFNEMADCYDRLHDFRKAVRTYQKSLLYSNKPIITYYVLAYLCDSELKDNIAALKYYKKYLRANPPEKQKSYIDYAKKRLKELVN